MIRALCYPPACRRFKWWSVPSSRKIWMPLNWLVMRTHCACSWRLLGCVSNWTIARWVKIFFVFFACNCFFGLFSSPTHPPPHHHKTFFLNRITLRGGNTTTGNKKEFLFELKLDPGILRIRRAEWSFDLMVRTPSFLPTKTEIDHWWTGEKIDVETVDISSVVSSKLDNIQSAMFEKAKAGRDEKMVSVTKWEDFVPALNRDCLVLTPFCDLAEWEDKVKVRSLSLSPLVPKYFLTTNPWILRKCPVRRPLVAPQKQQQQQPVWLLRPCANHSINPLFQKEQNVLCQDSPRPHGFFGVDHIDHIHKVIVI